MNYKIAIGVDHRGYELKQYLLQKTQFGQYTVEWIDCGAYSSERTDYPCYARKVVDLMLNKEADYGVMACGSGIGMVIAANRSKGIYAGLLYNEHIARDAKADDNVNVVVLPADYISPEQAVRIIETWLNTPFKEGRYAERLKMID